MASSHLPSVSKIPPTAPFGWLRKGWRDFCRAPVPCLAYGACLTAISLALAAGLFLADAYQWILVLAAGFLLVAPMLAMGLYEAGRKLERCETPSIAGIFFVRSALRQDIFILGLALVLIFSVWVEMAYLMYGLSTSKAHGTLLEFLRYLFGDPSGIRMAVIGSFIGGTFALIAFSLVVISAPMLLNDETDAFTATITSVRCVTRNFLPMMIWAALIVAMMGIGTATGFLGLVVIFPVIGLASWHAYRELVPSPADGH